MGVPLGPPAPDAPGGCLPADLADLVDELGASYPLLAYALQTEEHLEEEMALDPIILAGLGHPYPRALAAGGPKLPVRPTHRKGAKRIGSSA
jgi:hypothetical protein